MIGATVLPSTCIHERIEEDAIIDGGLAVADALKRRVVEQGQHIKGGGKIGWEGIAAAEGREQGQRRFLVYLAMMLPGTLVQLVIRGYGKGKRDGRPRHAWRPSGLGIRCSTCSDGTVLTLPDTRVRLTIVR